ncbi:hypothetical protein AALP_AA8G114800 [Arabis alpina]|uniref:OTU domain-containing protein n=1 Tax=Arabis alpina TaxID=50452 RepID=A0A087G6D2_ARAAL|nr:hypothetical protein AALP_AA8G114800 [Arabis alpina]
MSTDHKKRLQARLEWEGYSETKVKGDGNCQFSALADQLFNSSDLHEKVREQIVKQLKYNPKSYKALIETSKKRTKNVPRDFSEYVKNMSRNGEWGDEVTLQAAADTFEVKIQVVTSFKEDASMEILPKSQNFKSVIYLSNLAGVHYNSIRLEAGSDTTPMELQGKSKKEKEKDKTENDKDKDTNEKKIENKDESENKTETENEIKDESENKNEIKDENDKDSDKNNDKDNEKKKKKNIKDKNNKKKK